MLCVKEKRKPCRCKEKLFQAKSTPLQARSQNKPLLNLCFLSFLLQKSAGCDLINKCAPTDAPGPEVSRLISQIQFEVDALIGIPYLSLQAPPRLEQRGDVNLDGAHWITLSLSLSFSLSLPLSPLSLSSLSSLSLLVWSYCMLNVQALGPFTEGFDCCMTTCRHDFTAVRHRGK